MNVTGARRWWALGAISLAVLAITLDVTVLTVALPTLAGTLKASESQLQWFVSAYTLALVAAMLPAGLLGDRYGRKAVMVGALLLFAAGSAGCALAPNAEVFIAARVALGLAGAAIIVLALSILTVLFDEAERPRAVGIWGAANFVGLPLGPIIGGWMLTNVWWGGSS
jgi:MFS family permease